MHVVAVCPHPPVHLHLTNCLLSPWLAIALPRCRLALLFAVLFLPQGVGPRYCPSIEKKIIRFPDKAFHQVWLEPEGLDTHTVYPSGINTALPPDVQVEMLRSMKGLENVEMVRRVAWLWLWLWWLWLVLEVPQTYF